MSLQTFTMARGLPDRFHFVTAARPTIDTTTVITSTSLSDAYERSQQLDANGYPIYTSSELALLIQEAFCLYRAFHTRFNSGDPYAIECRRADQLRIFLDFYAAPDWETTVDPVDLADPQYGRSRVWKWTEAFYAGAAAFWDHPDVRKIRVLTLRERQLDVLCPAYGGDKSAALQNVDNVIWDLLRNVPDEPTCIIDIVRRRARDRDFVTWSTEDAERLIGELNFCTGLRAFDLRQRGRSELPEHERPKGYLERRYADPNRFMDAAEEACRVHGKDAVSGNLWMCFRDFMLKWWIMAEPAERTRLLEAASMDEWRKALVENLSHAKPCLCEGQRNDCSNYLGPGFWDP
ncbi:hypothetical protein BKA80DRAFT_115761 [Phyllosticta citrichinensis]